MNTSNIQIINTQVPEQKNKLIAFFSYSGNTKEIALQIRKQIGGELFEIKRIKDYPPNYNDVLDQAKQEIREKIKPELKTNIKNPYQYDIIFIGYPNWWST